MAAARQTTGVPGLDKLLGGGLIPGTLSVIIGATGIGKTQMGVHYAHAGIEQEGHGGVFFDMCSRGDSQNHANYAHRMKNWDLELAEIEPPINFDAFLSGEMELGDYMHIFDYSGKRVTKRDLDWNEWHDWQAQLNNKLTCAIAFLFGNCLRGTKRVVVDGVEPVGRPNDSIQINLFEYIYHQILRKDPEWVARDLLRVKYRENAPKVAKLKYDSQSLGCMMLYTSHETMLDDMIARPLDEGDTLSNANTLIYMGKIRDGMKVRRALYIAKHRGSACSEDIIPYHIDDSGIILDV